MNEKILSVDNNSFKTASFKEVGFESSSFNSTNLLNIFKLISDPNHPDPPIKAPIPNVPGTPGVSAGSFIEKPSYSRPGAWFFPLNSGTPKGILLSDYLNNFYKNPGDKYRSNIVEEFSSSSGVKNIPLSNYFGIHTFDGSYNRELLSRKNLKSLWTTEGSITTLEGNIVNDPEGISLKGESHFRMQVSIPENATYCINMYARVVNTNSTTLQGPYFKDSTGKNIIATRCISGHKSHQISDPCNFTVNGMWAPVCEFFQLNTGDYTLCIDWIPQQAIDNLRIAGIHMTKSDNYWYYDFKNDSEENKTIKYPLVFNLDGFSYIDTSSWVICYSRRLITDSLSNFPFIDSIGNINMGIRNNKFYLGDVEKDIPSDYIRDEWETVILSFDSNTKTLSSRFINDEKTILGPECKVNESFKRNIYNVNFDLGLGTYIKNSMLFVTPGSYKNLYYIPAKDSNDIDDIIKGLTNSLFSLSNGKGINDTSNFKVALRCPGFIETKLIEE